MKPDLPAFRVSQVGVALFVISMISGAGLSALLNTGAPLVGFGLIAVYLLFAIRVADQWEKVAVLRFGKGRQRGERIARKRRDVDAVPRLRVVDAEYAETALGKPAIADQRGTDFSRADDVDLPLATEPEDNLQLTDELGHVVPAAAFAKRAEKAEVLSHLRGRRATVLSQRVARNLLLTAAGGTC